jgi:hypothetical protein
MATLCAVAFEGQSREQQMTERASSRGPTLAAAEAVKAYIRMNRAKLSRDGEILALLLPERFASGQIRDLQRHIIERLAHENAALRAERDGLSNQRDGIMRLDGEVRQAVLDLVDARSFEETIAIARSSAARFGAQRATLCVEGQETVQGSTGVRLIAAGTVDALLGEDGNVAVLSGASSTLLGKCIAECRSLAVFRLKIGGPAALYVLGANAEHHFDRGKTISDLAFFARALERAIRTWLDLPKF